MKDRVPPVQEASGIWKVVNKEFTWNTYICRSGTPGECFLVDPGLDRSAIESALGELALIPKTIFCTHGHFDHAGSASFFQEQYGTRVYLHRDDEKILKASNFVLMALKHRARVTLPRLDLVSDDDCIAVAGGTVRYHGTPGHTPGSCVLEFGDILFTGDTLFARSVGLSRLPGEDTQVLRRSLEGLWNRFSPDQAVLPGHGRSASFGSVKQDNIKLREFMGMPQPHESDTSS